MTNFNRSTLPDTVRSNGATPNPWWANAVVYQIYPRSFQDSNGDGIGDLKGITSRLDYLADLGVDVLWLSPVFKSPQDDNGYDISDYQDIDPLFGTMADMDELLAEAHKRGLKVIMDLVVNHTSDEHAWFQASRDKNDPHADWYWWRPAKPGHEPGTPGAEPNQWGSYFGGSAWEYDPKRGEYFFHQYSKKQPDLNWENPEVRKAVYKMMNWWMDRGIDGFRMDVITQISKTVDKNGRLPGEDGSEIADLPVGEEGYSSPFPFCSDGPRIDEFLAEMRREVFEGREGYINVGEAPGITPARNEHVTDPANKELDMLFLFDHVGIDQEGSKWNTVPFEVKNLRDRMTEQQEAVRKAGWASLFFCNHDQPRVVSRWGNDSDRDSRELSAKAFGMVLHMHRGTPYIYEGEELGMTNAHFTKLEQYRDLEALNGYRQRVEEAKCQSSESMMAALALHRPRQRAHPHAVGRLQIRRLHRARRARRTMDQRQPESCGNQRGRGIRRSGFRVHVLQEAHRHAAQQRHHLHWRMASARRRQRSGVCFHAHQWRRHDSCRGQPHRQVRGAAFGRGGAAFRRRVRSASTAQHL